MPLVWALFMSFVHSPPGGSCPGVWTWPVLFPLTTAPCWPARALGAGTMAAWELFLSLAHQGFTTLAAKTSILAGLP